MILKHKNFIAKVEPDESGEFMHGEVINTKDIITFQGRTIKQLEREFTTSVTDYIDFCHERGEEPEKPFSGQFPVRALPELHRDIYIAASKDGKSMNAWVVDTLASRLKKQA